MASYPAVEFCALALAVAARAWRFHKLTPRAVLFVPVPFDTGGGLMMQTVVVRPWWHCVRAREALGLAIPKPRLRTRVFWEKGGNQ